MRIAGTTNGNMRMKRMTRWALLLLGGLGALTWAQNAEDARDAAARREAAEIRATADRLIASGVPDDVAKGAVLLEKAAGLEQARSNAEKLALEREKLRWDLQNSQGSHWKETFIAFTPLFTTLILAGTLIFQIQQAQRERRDRRIEAAEDARQKKIERDDRRAMAEAEAKRKEKQRFTDALKDLQTSERISTAAALINTFREEPYRSWVLETAVTMLLARETMAEFQTLYMEMLNPLTYDNMPQIRRLCKEVDSSYFLIATPIWDEQTASSDTAKLSEKDRKLFQLYSEQQSFLSSKLAGLLHNAAPAGVSVDLSGLVLRDMDLSGVDLGTAIIAASNWNFVNVDECDMSRITEFDNCVVYYTAWWHAARISKLLLQHLAKNFPYSPEQRYNTKRPLGTEEYSACVARLEAGGSETGGSRARGAGRLPAGAEASGASHPVVPQSGIPITD
ncbi:MAG TPA: hypothetical protein VNX26_04665 [Candidatus Acidoferrum sp.]|nr:hypothetical protein [Candidatus Acidoferrum sp.]